MNKKIAISTMSILTSLALMGSATFAFFSDTATSTGNTFSTGTLDLRLSDAAVNGGTAETNANSVTSSFGSDTLVPGACTGNQTLNLRNVGTVAAHHAEVRVANVVTDNGTAATPDMDAYLRLSVLTYDGVSQLASIPDSNGNTFKDLADWAALSGGLDDLSLTNLNTDHPLVMDVCLDNSAPNAVQGDSVSSTFTVDLNQDASQ